MSPPETEQDVISMKISAEDLRTISLAFEAKTPQETLAWAIARFYPHLTLACSFGAEDVALVDMIVKIQPDTQIFYLDTGVLFRETYDLRDRLIQKYGIRPIQYLPELTLDQQAERHGPELWASNPDMCCNIRKVQPLQRALAPPLQAWITGIRRDQTPARANAGIVEYDKKFRLVKINPLVRWTSRQVWEYIQANDVPYNPLHEQGYPSIGCIPCTVPVRPGEDPRSGRWRGFNKDECGLHSSSNGDSTNGNGA